MIGVEMFSHSYSFLNRRARIFEESSGKVDWEYAAEGGLWLDNLHYMRYWDGLGAHLSIQQEANLLHWLKDWAQHVTATVSSKALNPPYNASERAFSLGRFLLTHESLTNASLVSLIKLIIARDLNLVACQLEYHLGGNHLLKNLIALAWGGCLFEGEDANRWQAILNKVLDQELSRQILADGFHYERSPMYHNIALLDILDVINIAADGPFRDSLLSLARHMTAATKLITHPSGEISFFNDCALDSCPRSIDITNFSESLCGFIDKPKMLPYAGLYSLKIGRNMNVIAKFGALGAEEQMGHVHSDLFSFEMSVNCQMLFVNSGTSTYYDQPFRDYERSDEAHNTVVVRGYTQCEYWSNFRVASRTSPEDVIFEFCSQGGLVLSGVVQLLGTQPRPRMMRKFESLQIGSLNIIDVVSGLKTCAYSNFHLHPGVRIFSVDQKLRKIILMLPDRQRVLFSYSSGNLEIIDCLVSRRFNSRIPSKKLVISGWNELNECSSLEVKIESISENNQT